MKHHAKCVAFIRQVTLILLSHFTMGIWTSSNTWFNGPTRVHNPNGILISSAIFAQRSVVGDILPHSKLPLPTGDLDPHLILGSWGPPDSISQRASWSVQLFLHSSRQTVLILYNGPPIPPKNCPFPRLSGPHLIRGSLGPSESTTQTASRSVQPFL